MLTGFAASFFRPAIHKTDEIKNRVEIAEKIKNGNFSQEEAEVLLKGDKQLKKWISKYYETISKEDTITKIEANMPIVMKLVEGSVPSYYYPFSTTNKGIWYLSYEISKAFLSPVGSICHPQAEELKYGL